MSKTAQQHVHRPSVEEEFARVDLAQWKEVVARVDNPTTARMIVQFMDAHPQMKEANAGVYLAAAVTVKNDQIRYAKGHRAGRQVASILYGLLRLGKVVFGLTCSATSLVTAEFAPARRASAGPSPAMPASESNLDIETMASPSIVEPFQGDRRIH